MASLTKKIKKGRLYYFVECKRINGKPRIVEQHYLGTADKIFKTCQNKSAPAAKEVALTRIGPLALWDVARSTKLPEMIDAAFPKRNQGASVSQISPIIMLTLDKDYGTICKFFKGGVSVKWM